MPGMIAIAGRLDPAWDRLHQEFNAIWPRLENHNGDRIRMAAHAHRGAPLFPDARGRRIAVDGEAGIYRPRKDLDLEIKNQFAYLSGGFLQVGPECKGNLLVAGISGNEFHFAAEWTGTFPLYYLHLDRCLLVSSHLRPLGRASNSEPDMVGVFEYLRFAYNIAGRTLFEHIRRVLPGQAFRYDPDSDSLDSRECSRLWTGLDSEADPSETAWTLLKSGVQRSVGDRSRIGLMLSGGWDSRTLLAAASEQLGAEHLTGYSHGDTQSRELKIVRKLSAASGITCHLNEIDDSAYDLEALEKGFARVENVVFPHWHRAGVLLNEMSAEAAAAGVYGEILGGHYGPAMRMQGLAKIIAVGRGLAGLAQAPDAMSPDQLVTECERLFGINSLSKPWTVRQEAWGHTPEIRQRINEDVAQAVARLTGRGVRTPEQMVEAFITEHRGTQYINMQLLSCRAFLDVAMPFADQVSLEHASHMPLPRKIHNRINQQALSRHRRALLHYPLAATLVNASYPIPVQEVSRVLRRVIEDLHWKVHFATGQRVHYPRLGWVDFEFLRSGKALRAITDHLSGDFWDLQAIRKQVTESAAGRYANSMHPLSDAMLKIMTVDLMLH